LCYWAVFGSWSGSGQAEFKKELVVAASLCRGALGLAISTATQRRGYNAAILDRKDCAGDRYGIYCPMHTYPTSPKERTGGMMYFPRMLDKIRLHLRGELHEEYQENFGALKAVDGVCCNFLRVHHRDLIERVKQGGTDEEILKWCFEKGRPLNNGDLFVWNGFASKLGWRDSIAPLLEQRKKEMGIAARNDVQSIPDLIDFEEGRFPAASTTP
jgi:hypothetical protein